MRAWLASIPELLDMLDIKGSVITIDVMGRLHDIKFRIIDCGADHMLGVKDNQAWLERRSQALVRCRR
jgi:predicted transposase YbfD/YdcC